MMLEKAGEIHDLRQQVQFELLPVQREPEITGPRGGKKPGKLLEKSAHYIADFVYYDSDGRMVVEDVKGYKDGQAYALYVLKRKMMLYKYGIKIKEV